MWFSFGCIFSSLTAVNQIVWFIHELFFTTFSLSWLCQTLCQSLWGTLFYWTVYQAVWLIYQWYGWAKMGQPFFSLTPCETVFFPCTIDLLVQNMQEMFLLFISKLKQIYWTPQQHPEHKEGSLTSRTQGGISSSIPQMLIQNITKKSVDIEIKKQNKQKNKINTWYDKYCINKLI